MDAACARVMNMAYTCVTHAVRTTCDARGVHSRSVHGVHGVHPCNGRGVQPSRRVWAARADGDRQLRPRAGSGVPPPRLGPAVAAHGCLLSAWPCCYRNAGMPGMCHCRCLEASGPGVSFVPAGPDSSGILNYGLLLVLVICVPELSY